MTDRSHSRDHPTQQVFLNEGTDFRVRQTLNIFSTIPCGKSDQLIGVSRCHLELNLRPLAKPTFWKNGIHLRQFSPDSQGIDSGTNERRSHISFNRLEGAIVVDVGHAGAHGGCRWCCQES